MDGVGWEVRGDVIMDEGRRNSSGFGGVGNGRISIAGAKDSDPGGSSCGNEANGRNDPRTREAGLPCFESLKI